MAKFENLQIGQGYSKKHLANIINEPQVATLRAGLLYCKNRNTTILFVTLDKKNKKKHLHYKDFFKPGYFKWDSQNTQSFETPEIQAMYNRRVDIHLMCRVFDNLEGRTQPFIYCGELEYFSHDKFSKNPVHITFCCKDYQSNTHNDELKKLYNWKPGT